MPQSFPAAASIIATSPNMVATCQQMVGINREDLPLVGATRDTICCSFVRHQNKSIEGQRLLDMPLCLQVVTG